MFFSLLIENLAIALIERSPLPGYADFILALLNPLYELLLQLGL